MASDQKRIFMWSIPRSLSTAFLRCMMSRDSCKGYLEPWSVAYYFSADRVSTRFSKEKHPNIEGATFKETKEMWEGKHEDFKEVFVKDQAYRVKAFLDAGTVEDVIPKGYTHTFLIRHPAKSVTSLYQATAAGHSGFEGFHPEEASFEELVKAHEYVTQTLGQKSVILDADDLQRNPETTLRLYCEAVGIEFQDSMIHWRPLTEEQYKEWQALEPWMKVAMETTGFLAKTPSKLPDVKDLPEIVQRSIEEAIPFYKKLYERRLRPKNYLFSNK